MRQTNNPLRAILFAGILLATSGWASRFTYGANGPGRPTNLKCEYLTGPMGIDVREPRFSWVLQHSERGQKQTAFQVLVSTERGLLDQDKGNQWDSGKMTSDESVHVVYAGKPLESGRSYFWKVRTWDAQGNASPYSLPARFDMGLLAADEWKGQWIGGAGQFRKEFEISGKVMRARAYITALGYYELRLNGQKVGPNVLDPGWTTYEKRNLYTTYDITPFLKPGKNALGVMLGNGWAVPPKRYGPPIITNYSSPAFLLQMNIEGEGGKLSSVVSDTSWKATRGPIVSDGIFDGETYDARLETPGWDLPSFDDSSWSAAQKAESPGGVLSAQMMPPIRVVDTIVPKSMTNPQPGVLSTIWGRILQAGSSFACVGRGGRK